MQSPYMAVFKCLPQFCSIKRHQIGTGFYYIFVFKISGLLRKYFVCFMIIDRIITYAGISGAEISVPLIPVRLPVLLYTCVTCGSSQLICVCKHHGSHTACFPGMFEEQRIENTTFLRRWSLSHLQYLQFMVRPIIPA